MANRDSITLAPAGRFHPSFGLTWEWKSVNASDLAGMLRKTRRHFSSLGPERVPDDTVVESSKVDEVAEGARWSLASWNTAEKLVAPRYPGEAFGWTIGSSWLLSGSVVRPLARLWAAVGDVEAAAGARGVTTWPWTM